MMTHSRQKTHATPGTGAIVPGPASAADNSLRLAEINANGGFDAEQDAPSLLGDTNREVAAGSEGPKGPPGPKGPSGPKGPPGSAPQAAAPNDAQPAPAKKKKPAVDASSGPPPSDGAKGEVPAPKRRDSAQSEAPPTKRRDDPKDSKALEFVIQGGKGAPYSADTLDHAIDEWRKANTFAAFATLKHAVANAGRIAEGTGGQPIGADPDTVEEALGGVWGNIVTDAPDTAFKGLGFGLADAAEELVGTIGGAESFAVVLATGGVVGVAGGLAAGLVVSAVLATATEMAIDHITGKAASDRLASDVKAAEVAAKVSKDTTTGALKGIENCEMKVEEANASALQLSQAANRLQRDEDRRIVGTKLLKDAAGMRKLAPSPTDFTLANDTLRDWALENAGEYDPFTDQGKSNGRVNDAAWGKVIADPSIMNAAGGKGLAGETGTGAFDHNLANLQLRGHLDGAGIDAAFLGRGGVDGDGKIDRLPIADPEKFAAFVKRNWGTTVDAAEAPAWKATVLWKLKVIEHNDGPIVARNLVLESTEICPVPKKGDWLPGKVFGNYVNDATTSPATPA